MPGNSQRVSVIVPTYNEEGVIGKCLESLDKQSYPNFEVILVDDGGTDATLTIARELRIRNYDLRILKQSHKGPGAARNLGASKARGSILVFVDADMTFEPNFVEKLVEPIILKKSKGTFSKEEYVSNWDNVWAKAWSLNEGWEAGRRHPENYPDKQKVFRAVLKTEFDRVGGFDPGGYTDDWSLSKKLGYDATVAKGAKFYHENPDTITEVFIQARWVGKRAYKLGIIGVLYALLRSSLPSSLIVGVIKSVVNFQPAFLLFKVVYDFGNFVGIIEFVFFGKGAK